MNGALSADADDDALILALRNSAQRRQATLILHRRYAHRFMAWLCRRGMDHAQAEDAVQEAFIRILKNADMFKARGEGRAWIWTVARSAWLDEFKKQQRQPQWVDAGVEPAQSPDVASVSDYQDCVHGQLHRFSEAWPEAGQAVIWAAADGFKTAQIAELLGRSAGATREFLSQARKRLREYMEPCMGL
ncbi:MAG: RNA polymerase sigma factor [Oceanococcus sp.]